MSRLSSTSQALPPPIVIVRGDYNLDELLEREWLLTNGIGAYASASVIGCNTRRYHGLLVAATSPPVGRINALTTVAEWLTVGETTYDLSTNEFSGSISPRGVDNLVEFDNDVAPTFVYRFGAIELLKRIILAERKNAVAIQYVLYGGSGVLHLRPFAAMRDFHHLRQAADSGQLTFQVSDATVIVQDRQHSDHTLHLSSQDAEFSPGGQWWYRFHYRQDHRRGQDAQEDLYSPGTFRYELSDSQPVQFNASLDEAVAVGFDTTSHARRDRLEELASSVGADADQTTRRLAVATDAFVVLRHFPARQPSATILAGYPWFADWGRDAFIALPGLLLSTKRYDMAKGVFATFAEHLSEGMIPNRFDDYSMHAHYNSIDASLWFIVAAERYMRATEDHTFWRDVLRPTAAAILDAYQNGTRFGIHADADGLLAGGTDETQLTWMDAKLGDEVITARHGKAVEVNALWYCAHRILAARAEGVDRKAHERYDTLAHMIAQAFRNVFYNAEADCLFDCVKGDAGDASIRPNQILAVSLPYSPLTDEMKHGVLHAVSERLLTPMGLRTLSPGHSGYRGQYSGSWESRDRAYHQGTAWTWLLGHYVEAFLKLYGDKPFAIERAKELLRGFDSHLLTAGLGQVSEIFDGDSPHTPRGCIAQAWSVAEVLRAKQLVGEYEKRLEQ